MALGLAVLWAHPYQAQLSSLDEVVKKLTLFIKLGNNWAYTFVQLNKDAQHVPVSNEGHLSATVNGAPCRSMYGCLHQLEVCKLLQYGDQVAYPEGLKGGLKSVQTLLSGPILWGLGVLGDSTCEPSFLPVDLSQATLGYCMPEAPTPHTTLTPYSPSHLTMKHPPKTDHHISMTTEVQELLSCATPDTSGQASGDSTPKRPTSAALGTPPSTRTEDSSKLAAPLLRHQHGQPCLLTPCQLVTFLLWPWHQKLSRWPVSILYHHPRHPPGMTLVSSPLRYSICKGRWTQPWDSCLDDCHRKWVSDTKAAFHENEAQTTEAILKVKTHCMTAIWDTETVHATTIREAEAHCMTAIQDTEAACSTAIWEEETACVDSAHIL